MAGPRVIAPEYTFRFATSEIKAKYGTAENAFAAGDFLLAAQLAEPDSEIRGCALVLGGLTEQGSKRFAEQQIGAALCRVLSPQRPGCS